MDLYQDFEFQFLALLKPLYPLVKNFGRTYSIMELAHLFSFSCYSASLKTAPDGKTYTFQKQSQNT
ncbi:hypothetical protein APZ00_16105 [Pannonibacter phragmitetus]|uniref:Uncharacterized protein n=1 Tax=Pannonibacter phragmitetus TaxID=121719 RepID=A0A0U3NFG1_9HYPH|nr:hypothetical protein APZ00_16105 [Pannonibacter phragmitetus]